MWSQPLSSAALAWKRRAVRVMEGLRSVHLPGNSATASQFPRQTEGLRAIWTFWLAPSTESAAKRDPHGHGLLEGPTRSGHIETRANPRRGGGTETENLTGKAFTVLSWEKRLISQREKCVFSDDAGAEINRLQLKRHRSSRRSGPY